MQIRFMQFKNKQSYDMGYTEKFVRFLHKECKYNKEAIRTNTYKYDGQEYSRVEVLSGGYIIQAFVLMDKDHCRKQEKFPFYRTYSQWNDYGRLTPPACNVAVYNEFNEKWEIHSSSDLRHEITDPNFLNYDKAVERFEKRLHFFGSKKLMGRVSILSYVALGLVLLYVAAYLLSINGYLWGVFIPMDSVFAGILVLVVILILLPPLIPYLKIKYGEVSMEINPE